MSKETNKFSQLFTLRLWRSEDDTGEFHWRGKLHHINNDEIRYFNEWASLMPLLFSMLKGDESQTKIFEEKEEN